jgi:hypothetical protein
MQIGSHTPFLRKYGIHGVIGGGSKAMRSGTGLASNRLMRAAVIGFELGERLTPARNSF